MSKWGGWSGRGVVLYHVDEPVTSAEERALKQLLVFVWGLFLGMASVIATGALTVWLAGRAF